MGQIIVETSQKLNRRFRLNSVESIAGIISELERLEKIETTEEEEDILGLWSESEKSHGETA